MNVHSGTIDHDYTYIPKLGREQNKTSKSLVSCCVPMCKMYGYKTIEGHGRLSYHAFPPVGDPLRKQWLINIRRDENETFRVTKHTVVCSLHFAPGHLEYHEFCGRRTKLPGCVPTIFDCWKNITHIYKEPKDRPSNKLQQIKENSSNLEALGATYTEPVAEVGVGETQVSEEEIPVVPVACQDIGVSVFESEVDNLLLKDEIQRLLHKLEKVKAENNKLKHDKCALSHELEKCKFSVDNVSERDFSFYTGFASRTVFDTVLNFLNPGQNGENIKMNNADYVCDDDEEKDADDNDDESSQTKRGRPRKLSPANQFFLFMCRVKVGMFEVDLANRFAVSLSTVSTIIISWSNFIYMRLGVLNIWPSKQKVLEHMPDSFKEKYPSTRVIIDCTELKVEMASSLLLKSQTYSNYKSANTLKGLIGIAPSGSVCFVSQLYTGCISDREITIRSGLLDLPFDNGDSVMADKGFDIQDLLCDLGVTLNIPPFLGLSGQMTGSDVLTTQSVAAERIHVERAINKIKGFHIFDQVIPLSLSGSINQIWTVCALLTLFQEPIISAPKVAKS